jgi:hypothetical protein
MTPDRPGAMLKIWHSPRPFLFGERDISWGKGSTNAMINYARERSREMLKTARVAVLATTGPAGVQVSEFPCEAVELDVYLLLPRTSDHLFNLEQDDRVALHTDRWDLTGKGRLLEPEEKWPPISLLPQNGTAWYVLVKVVPTQIHVLRPDGWGPAETIDLTPFSNSI